MQRKKFGNTWLDFKGVLIAGLIIGLVMAGVFVGVAMYHHRASEMWRIAPFGLVIGLIMPLFVSPTLLFSIVIEDGKIIHRLCRRWVLSSKPLGDLMQLDVGYSAGAKFYFVDRSSISFMGAHLKILEAMCTYIRELRPDFQGFRFGPRAAFMLAVINKMEAKKSKS